MFFAGLFLTFDLNSLIILILIVISLIFSVLSNLVLLNISLNIVTSFHLIMLPAFIFEFFYSTTYLFLYKIENEDCLKKLFKNKKDEAQKIICKNGEISGRSLDNYKKLFIENENSTKNLKFKNLIFVNQTTSKISCLLLFLISIFSLILTFFSETYNFRSLFNILFVTSFNLLLHINLFYPILLFLCGTTWKNGKNQIEKIM
jgi:hypothetical protein